MMCISVSDESAYRPVPDLERVSLLRLLLNSLGKIGGFPVACF